MKVTPLQLLEAARNLIATPERWSKGAVCRDSKGKSLTTTHTGIYSWSICGALSSVFSRTFGMNVTKPADGVIYSAAWNRLRDAAKQLYNMLPEEANDAHDHAAALRIYDSAIEAERHATR